MKKNEKRSNLVDPLKEQLTKLSTLNLLLWIHQYSSIFKIQCGIVKLTIFADNSQNIFDRGPLF